MKPSNRRFWIGAAAGLIATLVMSIVMVLGFLLGAHYLPEPLPFALLADLVGRALHQDPASLAIVIIAIPLHFAYGALWAAGASASTSRMTWQRGLVVGLDPDAVAHGVHPSLGV